MSTPEDNTIRALLDEQAAHAVTIARRNLLHDALRRMAGALTAAGHPAGFGPDEVEQAVAATLADLAVIRDELKASEASNAALRAELEALQARTARLIAAEAGDPRDPPVDTCDCAERTAAAEQRSEHARRMCHRLLDDIIDGRRR